MKIGLDFDGVISNCAKLKSHCAKMLHGVDIPAGLFKRDLVIGNGWLTAEQFQEVGKAVYYSREFGSLLEPVDGTLSYLPKLIQDRHTVLVITSRKGIELEIAEEWLCRQGLALEFISVGGYHNSKAGAAMGFDVYVDDDLHKLQLLVGVVPNLFLFSWEHNRRFNESGVAVRVLSWEELYKKIETL